RRGRRPGQSLRPGGQAPALPPRRHRWLRGPERAARRARGHGRTAGPPGDARPARPGRARRRVARGRRRAEPRRPARPGRPRPVDGGEGEGEWFAVSRTGDITRATKETELSVRLDVDGAGAGERRTGVGFFDHMLDLLARHGRLDLDVHATGDLETGAHHTV